MSEPELSKDTSTAPLSESRKKDILENLLPGIGLDGAGTLLSYTQERPVEAGRILEILPRKFYLLKMFI